MWMDTDGHLLSLFNIKKKHFQASVRWRRILAAGLPVPNKLKGQICQLVV